MSKGNRTWRELCIAQGGHRWMELQARSEKEKDLCSVQTKGQKKNHQSGWAALKWRKQLFIQWGDGQVRWAGNSTQKAICWPWTACPGGTEQILSSRRPHRGASASQGKQTMPGQGIKVTWASCKKWPSEFTSECEVNWKHSVFLFENLANPLCWASLGSQNAER